MLRAILGVILGYVVMFVVVFVGLMVAYLAIGAEKAFKPRSFEVSFTWICIWLVVGIVAALAGGCVCAAVSRSRTATHVLAGLVLVLGLLSAIPSFSAPAEEERTAQVGGLEAMGKAHSPVWMALANPLIGAIGVLVGGSWRRGGQTPDVPV